MTVYTITFLPRSLASSCPRPKPRPTRRPRPVYSGTMNAPTSLLAILPLLFHVALLGLSAFPFAGAQEVPASYACIDPSNPAMTTHVYRGEDTTICLYAGPGGNWNSGGVEYTRFAVNLKADEFSSYKIPKCEFVIILRLWPLTLFICLEVWRPAFHTLFFITWHL